MMLATLIFRFTGQEEKAFTNRFFEITLQIAGKIPEEYHKQGIKLYD
jgi:hypothetical protein